MAKTNLPIILIWIGIALLAIILIKPSWSPFAAYHLVENKFASDTGFVCYNLTDIALSSSNIEWIELENVKLAYTECYAKFESICTPRSSCSGLVPYDNLVFTNNFKLDNDNALCVGKDLYWQCPKVSGCAHDAKATDARVCFCNPNITDCKAIYVQYVNETVTQIKPTNQTPNPASVFCEQHGNTVQIITNTSGSQYGVCVFPDGSYCEEWKYYRGECPIPEKPVAWWLYAGIAAFVILYLAFEIGPDRGFIKRRK